MMQPDDATAAFLARWHAMAAARDVALLDALVADTAVIASPMFWKPQGPKPYVMTILGAVVSGFEDFVYTKEWLDPPVLLLEFTARIGETRLKGIDRIVLDADGRMAEIEVLIRPLNALQALGAHVMAKLAAAG